MRLLAPRADFDYGNTRLRVRRVSLLDRPDYEAMLGGNVDGILGALSSTSYHPDVEAAIIRYRGARRVHEAARQHRRHGHAAGDAGDAAGRAEPRGFRQDGEHQELGAQPDHRTRLTDSPRVRCRDHLTTDLIPDARRAVAGFRRPGAAGSGPMARSAARR